MTVPRLIDDGLKVLFFGGCQLQLHNYSKLISAEDAARCALIPMLHAPHSARAPEPAHLQAAGEHPQRSAARSGDQMLPFDIKYLYHFLFILRQTLNCY